MEKIIFFCLAIPIIAFIFYLGASAIMTGSSAKDANRSEKEEDNNTNFSVNKDQLSNELIKLNELLRSGVLTQEEYEKAKKKILND